LREQLVVTLFDEHDRSQADIARSLLDPSTASPPPEAGPRRRIVHIESRSPTRGHVDLE
jgi:hypothetical protein